MLVIWNLSLFISIVCLLIGLLKRSWPVLLLSTITSIPIAYYFLGANNSWKYVGFAPILLLLLTVIFWFMSKKNRN
ncbi:hypothetical protein ACFOZY_00190 [Chungangia koreensis]|uniref:NADH dehydrogenase subunit 4 n=1 Tax=Chungangia koreensis TaxID=752657 RepID=A0ABV8WYX2_9LACT